MDPKRLGAILLALLVVLALPGIVLALTYEPEPARAHDGVAANDAGPLRMARGGHAWAAAAVLVLVALHLGRAFVAGRMRAPGRGATLAGLGAFAILLAAYFTGTILPWDQQGWEAYEHLRSGAGAVGVDVGSTEPEGAPLRRIFLLHVLAVPAILVALLLVHLRRAGFAEFPRRILALLRATWIPIAAVAGATFVLAALAPPELGPAPIPGLRVTHPDWPFLWLLPLQDAFGARGLLALPLAFVVAAGAFLLPSASARASASASARVSASARRRLVVLAVLATAWLVLTLLGART